MWSSLIAKGKEGGLNVIQTYVFWNLHEPQPGQYDFSGRYDLVKFIKEIQAQGLYATLRIGPYIESEWTYGGFPFWLHDVPDIVYRSDNEPFKFYMQNFTTKIVNLMKSEGLYASQGGPIILSQIENEYQNVEAAFGEKGPSYVQWAAKMAVELETGVPWVMCKQIDAPDPVAYVFQDATEGCVAFLVNNDGRENATVQFQNLTFQLLPKSISILPDCETEIFNTAKVNTEYNERKTTTIQTFTAIVGWEEFKDDIPNFLDTSLKSNTLLEHMNTTKDKSDYLWYTLSFQHNTSCTEPVLHVESLGHVAHAFVNNIYAGAAHGNHDVKGFTMEIPIVLNDGMNNISILGVMVGLPDSGAFLERRFTGLTKVEIHCGELELYNFTNYEWGYQVGLLGEKLEIYTENKLGNAEWSKIDLSTKQPLTWYKTVFDAPIGNDPIALDLSPMGKGSLEPWEIWDWYGGDHLEDGQALYFFVRLKKVFLNGSRICRRVDLGTWAGEDSKDRIMAIGNVVGFKKRFHYENHVSPYDGDWVMHEFAIDSSSLRQHKKPDDIVLCQMKRNLLSKKNKFKQYCINSEPSKHFNIAVQQDIQVFESKKELVGYKIEFDPHVLFSSLDQVPLLQESTQDQSGFIIHISNCSCFINNRS
ncbi:hypothetical protein LWI28_008663 [Acer negundo]|uniref:Beta-galactosidase n=1 Tax=Acer negundo TaxID=4023 RepID=A0AAD5IHY4_ACENE|nr:hypothetical protein LWI28_008663 [Acer negundo]